MCHKRSLASFPDDTPLSVVNSLDTVALTGPLNANVPAPERRDHSFLRTQWALNAMQSLSLNYTFSDHSSESNGVGALVLPDQGFSLGQHAHRLQVIHSIALAPELRNEIVFVFKVQKDRTGGPARGPEILGNGGFTGGASQSFEGKERHAFDLQDTATYLRGQHNFLFGATIRNDWWNVFDKTNFGGTFEFSSLAQYENVVQNHIGTPDFFQINRGNPQVSFWIGTNSLSEPDGLNINQVWNSSSIFTHRAPTRVLFSRSISGLSFCQFCTLGSCPVGYFGGE